MSKAHESDAKTKEYLERYMCAVVMVDNALEIVGVELLKYGCSATEIIRKMFRKGTAYYR